jgi:glycosyltransferase involved in cell wall biosynthesis
LFKKVIKKKIILTIVITNFNKEKYLSDCLKSIISQKSEEIEIILIDDKSTDNSKKKFEKFNKKINIIYNKKNFGPSICRNIGIRKAKGLYIAFVDADDKIYPILKILLNKIKKQKKNNQLIILKYISSDEKLNNNDLFINKNKSLQEYSTDFYLKKKLNFFSQQESIWYILFLKTHLKNNKINFLKKSNCLEDLDFVTRSISLSKNIALLYTKYYYYRELKNSLKKDFSEKRALGALNVYKSLRYFIKKNKLSSIKRRLLNHRITFAKNIFAMRYYLLNKNKKIINKNIESYINFIKKKIIKDFLIKKNDQIAIYCYGPSGQFLYKILEKFILKKIIFIDDKINYLSKTSAKHKIYNFNNVLVKNYKIIIANPKKYIITNIKRRSPKLNMFSFDINKIL